MALLLCTPLCLLLRSSNARANPLDLFGFGSRVPAMGGAGTALTDDSGAGYYNPAALARGSELRLDVGYIAALPSLRWNGRDAGVDSVRGIQAGLVAPGRVGGVRFAFGVTLHLPDQRLTRVRALPFSEPRFVLYDNRGQRIFLAANLAVEIVPGKLWLGGGVAFMSRTEGTLNLKGNVAVSNPDDSSLVSDVHVDLVALRYPQLGMMWQAQPWLTVGATWRDSFRLDLDQGFRIDGSIGNPGMTPVVPAGWFAAHSVSTDLFQPMQFAVGFTARITRRLTLAYDVTYALWSSFPTPAAHLDLGLDLGKFDDLVHLPAPRSYPSPGFHDVVIPRLGVEARVVQRSKFALDARAGLAYEPSPVPEQTGESNLADNDKVTVSAGLGVELGCFAPVLPRPVAIDVHVAETVLVPRANRKQDPRDPVGDFVTDGNVLQLGVMLRSRF